VTPLGLGGAHRRHLPRGRRAGPQTWRRRAHGAWAYGLAAFGLLALATRTPAGAIAAALLLPLPYGSRPLRGGVAFARGPRRSLRRVACTPANPSRGDALRVEARGAREIGLVATGWTDVSFSRATAARPVRVYEAWAPPGTPLRIPGDAPFSYEGRRLSVAWAVVARLHVGSAGGSPPGASRRCVQATSCQAPCL
jgi:hypothetical protein